jgi:hypothetical protein
MKSDSSHRNAVLACVTAAWLLSACATSGPQSFANGTAKDEVLRRSGAPTAEYSLPGDVKRVEYTGGTYGKQTWMLDFNAAGALTQTAQVRTERRFNQVTSGMSKESVLLAVGLPSERSVLSYQKQSVWSYRFEDPFCRWFQVGLDANGRVVDTAFLPDPMCEPLGFGSLSLMGKLR